MRNRFSRGANTSTIITDLKNRSVFDLTYKRSAEAVAPYFEARRGELKNVAGVAMDMSAGYAKTAAEYMRSIEKVNASLSD
jgi:transposase